MTRKKVFRDEVCTISGTVFHVMVSSAVITGRDSALVARPGTSWQPVISAAAE